MTQLVLIAHNIRSTHNVGAFFRTAEGFGVEKIIISGYTPYPHAKNDTRLPHIAEKLTAQIAKTALGAEKIVPFEVVEDPHEVIKKLRDEGFLIAALEQDKTSVSLAAFSSPKKIALILGEEVSGVQADLMNVCDVFLEIPMLGKKESFNVSVACGIALYQLLIKNQ